MSGSAYSSDHLREYRAALRVDPSTFRSVRNLALFVVIEQILFLPLDFLVLWDAFGTFLLIRLTILASAAYVAIRACRTHPIESSIVMELQSGAMVLAMIAHDGGMTSRYCPGLLLTFCALPVFVPLSVRQVSISVLPSLLGFLLLPTFTPPLPWMDYALSSVFPFSGAMIALGSTWVLEHVRFAEFLRRKELEEARDHLRALDATKSRFTANVHHELRTPLTLILAPLEAMLEASFGAIPPNFAPHLESMRSNALRLLKLINNLLDLAKLESNQMTIRRRPLALAGLVTEIIQGAAGMAERKGVRLVSRFADGLPTVSADRDALEKILINLIGNALKFTESGGSIEVSAEPSPMGVRIVLADTGVGIPPDQLQRIFDRFAQVDTSATRKHEGTGIGLSLVRELVELHEGRVWATSAGIGHGAQMHVELPLGHQDEDLSEGVVETPDGRSLLLERAFDALDSDSADSESTRPDYKLAEVQQNVDRWAEQNQPSETLPPQPEMQGRQRVLVVEDNPDMRRLLSALLGDEFEVRTACNGREGLEKLRADRPDVVLSDVMMPEMSGLELCNAVKSDPATRSIPFLLVTSKADREMRVEGLELGADDYVTKPFHPRELLARVRSFARLRGLQDELSRRNRELQGALDQLKATQSQLVHQEKMASLGQLVAGVAHEINNPVHFIQGNVEFLEQSFESLIAERRAWAAERGGKLEETLTSDLASIFSGIREGVARTVRIVADLRTFSRLDRAEILEIDLTESLEATLNLLRARLKPVEVVREYGDLPVVSCLAGQLNQVFMNLIVNAVDAVGDGGRICIRTGVVGENVFVEIEDNGCGMTPDVLEHIFDPFFTTKEIGKGTGLGLSVSHGIIERHNGRIEVSSELGRGSKFRVEIPISAARAD